MPKLTLHDLMSEIAEDEGIEPAVRERARAIRGKLKKEEQFDLLHQANGDDFPEPHLEYPQ